MELRSTPRTNGHRRVAELKIAGRRVSKGKGQKLIAQDCYGPQAARPEGAEAPSPGHRPGYNGNQQVAL